MLRQTAEISKAINAGAVSVAPTGLECITAHKIESNEVEALLGVAHMRSHNLTEHIRLAAASRARAGAPQQFEFQKRFGAVIPGNGQFFSDLLDVAWLKSHFPDSSFKERRLSSRRGRSRDFPSLFFVRQKSLCQRAPASRPLRFQLENLASCPSKAAATSC